MEGTVFIDGEIVSEMDLATVWPCTSLQFIRNEVEWMGLGELGPEGLRVVINSPGGNADEGLAIFDYFRSLNIKITTEVLGVAGSIASVIFMAGDVRKVHPNATLHPHCPFGGIVGATAEEGSQYFADVQKVEDRLVAIYAERAGRPDEAEVIRALLKEDKDMSAEESLAAKFATLLVQPVKALAKLGHKPAAGAGTPSPQPAARAPHIIPRMAANKANPNPPASQHGRANFQRAAQRMLGDVMALLKGEKIKALSVSTGGDNPVEYNISTDDSNEIKSGDPITTAAGDAVPDSTITLADGTVVVVVGGLVDTVTAPAAAKVDETKTDEVENTLTDDEKKDGATIEEVRATLTRERLASTTRLSQIEQRLGVLASLQSTGATPPTVDPITNPTSTSTQRSASTVTAADANASETKTTTASAIHARKAQKAAGRK